MSTKRLLLLSCPLYLMFYMGDAFLTSYYSLYFIEKGASVEQQSILLGVIPFALMIGCILMSFLSKTRVRTLWLFRTCAAIEGILALIFPFVSGFPALLTMISMLSFFNGAPFSFIEGYVVPELKEKGISYSYVRVFGTLGYFFALLAGHFFLQQLPLRDSFFFASLCFLLAFTLSLFFPAPFKEIFRKAVKIENKSANLRPFWTKRIVLFFLSQFFLYGAFNATIYLIPVRLNNLGMTDWDYSLVRAFSIAAEAVLLFVLPLFFKKAKNKGTALLIGSSFALVSSLVGVFMTDPWALGVTSMIFAGVGKAFFFAYQGVFLEVICGEERLGRALAINNAVVNLASTALNFSSGAIYQNLGFEAYFGIISGAEAAGLLLLLYLGLFDRRETKEATTN